MMVNSKNKGSNFERDVVKLLNAKLKRGTFKRIPGSGAIGTQINEPILYGDITGKVTGIPQTIKIECKVGYGGEKQLTLKREWLNKIIEEASKDFSLPVLIGKFSGARKTDGVQEFVVLDLDTFIWILNLISDLQHELDLYYK